MKSVARWLALMLLLLLGAFLFIVDHPSVTRHSLVPVEGLVAEIAKRGVIQYGSGFAGKELL